MEFTPFVFYLIFIIVIYIPVVIYRFKNKVFHSKSHLYIYTLSTVSSIFIQGYISYLIYKKQDEDRKHAWMLAGSIVGFTFLIVIGVYLLM